MTEKSHLPLPAERTRVLERKTEWLTKLEAASGRRLERTSGTVYLVIDRSASMGTGDKLTQAAEGAAGFARDARGKGFRIGVVTFASRAEILLQPQRDTNDIASQLTHMPIGGSTNIGAGIRLATCQLRSANGRRVICVVTDGVTESPVEALNSAIEAKDQCIQVMAIGTDDADSVFLSKLVSQSDFVVIGPARRLSAMLTSAARLLPGKVG